MKRVASFSIKLFLLLVLFSLAACATVQKPLTGLVPGREVETLQSGMSISVKSGKHSTSGSGFLVFKQPDRFHMALLSPFGLTVFEAFIDRDRLTCLLPSKQIAYSGPFADLPYDSPLQSMAMMKWVVAKPPAGSVAPGVREVTAPSGDRFYFNQYGLVERKVSPEGDAVSYSDFQNINGVGFPKTIVITSRNGATVKIIFDDPQINEPVEESQLLPTLEGYSVEPLADFKGF